MLDGPLFSRQDADMTRQAYGSGSITKRAPGVWRLRVMVDGKQMQRTFRGTETAARRALRSWTPDEETEPTGDGPTFGALLDKWLAHITKRGRSPKTIDEARREIETRIRPRLGDVLVADLTSEHLDAAYSAWLDEGLAPSSVHRHVAAISAALSQGVRWKWITVSPAATAEAPSAKSARKLVTPTADQVGRLVRAAEKDDPMMAAAVALAFVTGARRGELAALRWSDIDLEPDAAVIRIGRSLAQVGERLIEKDTKTGRKRAVMGDAGTAALLRRHRAWQESLASDADSPLVADPYVLSDNANAGRPVRPSVLTDRFTKLRTTAKVSRVRFHDLRHAAATEMIAAGVPVPTVSQVLGHASSKMTLDRYADARPAGSVRAAAVMGALLPGVDA